MISKTKILSFYYNGLYNLFHRNYKFPTIKNTEDTLDIIINEKLSASRFGDGELLWALQKNYPSFQDNNPKLAEKLQEVLKSNVQGHIVCLPSALSSIEGRREKSKKWWKFQIAKFHKEWKGLLDLNKVYYDTQFSRLYMDYEDKTKEVVSNKFNKIKQVWNERNVIFIEGEFSRLGVGNDLFDNTNSIKRIICPSRNAFDKIELILKKTDEILSRQKSDTLILLALGPCATILAYELARKGYQAVDIGHVDIEYEWFLKGAQEKIPLQNKFVHEAGGMEESSSLSDELIKYKSEIICDLSSEEKK